MSVRVCRDGVRRIVVDREDGGMQEYSLWEPLDAGEECGFAVVRVVEGSAMGRADTRRCQPPPDSYEEALTHEEQQRRRAETCILTNCREVRRPGRDGISLGVFAARGRVRFVGNPENNRGPQAAVVPLHEPQRVRPRKRAAGC